MPSDIEVWTLVFQGIESIGIVVAAIVTVFGINTWRKESRWKKQYELAEEVLTCFYEAEESIKRMRNPWSSGTEGKSRVKSDSESSEESSILNSAFVLNERYNNEQQVFIKLRKLRYRFRVHFGNEKTKPFDDLNDAIVDLMNSAFMLGNVYWMNQGRKQWSSKEEFDNHLLEMSKHQAIFWRKLENDEFGERISKIVQAIESSCSRKIEFRG